MVCVAPIEQPELDDVEEVQDSDLDDELFLDEEDFEIGDYDEDLVLEEDYDLDMPEEGGIDDDCEDPV